MPDSDLNSDGDSTHDGLRDAFKRGRKALRTVADIVRYGATALAREQVSFGQGTDNAVDEAVALTLHALHLSSPLARELWSARLTKRERTDVLALFERRITGREPVAYITGRAWFAGLEFEVNPDVLVPRSPIAELIEQRFEPWLEASRVQRIADIGTGSGCIAVACAAYFASAKVDAIDVSGEALSVAARNVSAHDLAGRVNLVQADLMDGLDGRYDLIVSNPPYVDASAMASLPPEFAREPALGLAAGEDGLDCARRIIERAGAHLNKAGILVLEVGASQPALERAYPVLPFTWVEFERGGKGVCVLSKSELSCLV